MNPVQPPKPSTGESLAVAGRPNSGLDQIPADLLSAMHEGAIVVNGSQLIVYANGAALAMFGYSESALLGAPLETLIPDHSKKAHRSHVDRYSTSEEGTRDMGERGDIFGRHSDGHEFPVQINLTPIDGPDGPLLGAIIRNLGDLRDEQSARHELNSRYKLLFEQALEGIVETSLEGRILDANPAALKMFGVDPKIDAWVADASCFFADPDMYDRLLDRLTTSGTVRQMVCPMVRADGTPFFGSLTVQLIMDTKGNPWRGRTRIVDVTARIETQGALEQSDARFRSVLEHVTESILVWDTEERVTYASPSAIRLIGHLMHGDHLAARTWSEHAHPDDRQLVLEGLGRMMQTPGVVADQEFRFIDREGETLNLHATGINLVNDPAVNGFVIHLRDVTAQRRTEQTLQRSALHDSLTGLANRALLQDHLERTVAAMRRQGGTVGVLFIDLDHFKFVNDSLGHFAGDQVLQEIATRLKRIVRDIDVVARFGGDEFVVICHLDNRPARFTGVEGNADFEPLAHRIIREIALPMLLEGHEFTITASVGIATTQDPTVSCTDLLGDADAALYLAKQRGRDQFAFFDAEMRHHAESRLLLERELRFAIENNQLELYYQPIFQLANQRLVGFEALVRWNHPDRGMVQPDEFIPLAEDTGLIRPMTDWVLAEAARVLNVWQRDIPATERPYLAVNVASRQVVCPTFATNLRSIMAASGADPIGLVVEVTESSLITDAAACRTTLRELHEFGVRVAIDDFGTGYSSLSYLHSFSFDLVKIDRSFVKRLGIDPTSRSMINAIVAMANALNLSLIAEGIETTEQMDFLTAAGCTIGQGWLLGAPLPHAEVEKLLSNRKDDQVTNRPVGHPTLGGRPGRVAPTVVPPSAPARRSKLNLLGKRF